MSEADAVGRILANSKDARFLDLGSYNGADAAFMAQWGRGCAIEADPDNWCNLVRNMHSRVTYFNGAIASYTGQCDFWVCADPPAGRGSGSIHEPTGHLVRNGVPYTFKKIQIPCMTLDDLFARSTYDHLDVIWADLQGGEKDMIAGGKKTLALTRFMLIESEYAEELYKGQAMRDELLSLLPDWQVIETFDFNLFMMNNKLNA